MIDNNIVVSDTNTIINLSSVKAIRPILRNDTVCYSLIRFNHTRSHRHPDETVCGKYNKISYRALNDAYESGCRNGVVLIGNTMFECDSGTGLKSRE